MLLSVLIIKQISYAYSRKVLSHAPEDENAHKDHCIQARFR